MILAEDSGVIGGEPSKKPYFAFFKSLFGLYWALNVLIPGVLLSHNLVADDECILAFDINTTKTGLINYEDAVGSLNLHSNIGVVAQLSAAL